MRNGFIATKRLLVGRPMRSHELADAVLPKRVALPIYSSDALSSVAYATEEILKVLTLGALAYLYLTPWIALGVVFLMTVVVLSYRQVVHAYPGGGGSYEVASRNLGRWPGLVVAAALMVDYILTVAVSIASGVDNVISAVPALNPWRVELAVTLVAVLAVINMRGVKESGRAFAVPTYLFMAGILGMIVAGGVRFFTGTLPEAVSAHYQVTPELHSLSMVGLVFLGLRAFSSGCTALTGVEAVSNGVPSFAKPKARNAAKTLAALGVLAVTMFAGITALAMATHVRVVENTCDLVGFAGDCRVDPQLTVIAQLAAAVSGGQTNPFFYYVQATTALVLVLAANTAFNGFPVLMSILARHDQMPRQLQNRGDRLAFSNGIIMLAAAAVLLLLVYQASVTRLIQLYILGVFTSFTLSQIGMVKHWTVELRHVVSAGVRRQLRTSRVINGVGAALTGLVLVIVLVTKFTHGAYLVVIAIPALCWWMNKVQRHYEGVRAELAVRADPRALPSRVHAVVLASQMNEPTMRAIGYARATRPSSLVAITAQVDSDQTHALQRAWMDAAVPVPLVVLDAPYRDLTAPIVDYIDGIRRSGPRDLVAVFIPEFVVGHWWEEILHNHSAVFLRLRLKMLPGVMTIAVPYQIASAAPRAALEASDVRPLVSPASRRAGRDAAGAGPAVAAATPASMDR
ncbi:APC family permease [Nigerium sp.]|uniref:APC family permease n=1 Tax=Nigerium sp. TaxID=2042655 RepID=UPI0032215090